MKEKKWRICMCGVIKCNDEFLILKRKDDDEEMAGFWEFPSGNAEEGEDLISELAREVFEETGLQVEKKSLQIINLSQYNSEKSDYIKCSVQINYLLNYDEKPNVNLSSEHLAFDWATKDDVRLDEFLKEIISGINID